MKRLSAILEAWELWLIPIVATLGFGVNLIYSSIVLTDGNSLLKHIRGTDFPILEEADRNLHRYEAIVVALNTAATTAEVEFLDVAKNKAAEILGSYEALENLDAVHKSEIEKLKSEFNTYFALAVDISQQIATKTGTPNLQQVAKMRAWRDAYLSDSVAYRDAAKTDFHKAVSEAIRRSERAQVWGAAIGILMLLVIMALTLLVMRDIAKRKRMVAALRESEEASRIAATAFETHDGIAITDANANIIRVNRAFSDITGYSAEEVLGKNPNIMKSDRHDRFFYKEMWQQLLRTGTWAGEIWNLRKNGEVYPKSITITAVKNDQYETTHYVAIFSDITERKQNEEEIHSLAFYDALTKLPNRVLLADRLRQAMAQALRHAQLLAVAYLDLDGFKAINDRHGHNAGDQLLMTVATRMKQALRDGDTLARLGGDEFVAVLLDLTDIEACVPMLTRLLVAAAQPVHVGDLVLQVSASIGVTFYPQAGDIDADQLLRQADQAMYQAKLAGKNRFHVFDADQDRSVRGHHESLEHIRRALTEREFVLYYQPKVNMRTGMVIGAEALIRWQHPEEGLLPPAAFLPVIEDNQLAVELGEWVIDSALTQIEHWRAAGLDIPVSVNVCARQLQQADFVERLHEILAVHPKVRPGDLEMEVLETSALEDLGRVSQVIEDCREIGVCFALDDFGTGYSSLTYLKRLSVTQLKIDQSFVHDMLNNPNDLAILNGVLGLATAFRRQAIAEGVETVEQGAMLLRLGCELAQGYGIARPMPANELPGWLAAWRIDPAWSNLPAVSRDDIPVLFAIVEHRAWIEAIESYLKGERNAPPPLDHHQCHFGKWLDAEGLLRYSALPTIQAIELLHRQVHVLAAEMCELQVQGLNPEALAKLGKLHDLRNALLEKLKGLVREIRN